MNSTLVHSKLPLENQVAVLSDAIQELQIQFDDILRQVAILPSMQETLNALTTFMGEMQTHLTVEEFDDLLIFDSSVMQPKTSSVQGTVGESKTGAVMRDTSIIKNTSYSRISEKKFQQHTPLVLHGEGSDHSSDHKFLSVQDLQIQSQHICSHVNLLPTMRESLASIKPLQETFSYLQGIQCGFQELPTGGPALALVEVKHPKETIFSTKQFDDVLMAVTGRSFNASKQSANGGVSRDPRHKRCAIGRQQKDWRKKRKYEPSCQPGTTKLSRNKPVRRICGRGGNMRWSVLRLDTAMEKIPLAQVAAPFLQRYLQHCCVAIERKMHFAAKKEMTKASNAFVDETTESTQFLSNIDKRQPNHQLHSSIAEQFGGGRFLACISTIPGHCSLATRCIQEGKKLMVFDLAPIFVILSALRTRLMLQRWVMIRYYTMWL